MKYYSLFCLLWICQYSFSQLKPLDSVGLVRKPYAEAMKTPPQLIGKNFKITGKLIYNCAVKDCFPARSVTVSIFKEYKFYDDAGSKIEFDPDNPLHKIAEYRNNNLVQVNQKYKKLFLGKTSLKDDKTFALPFRSGSQEHNISDYPNLTPTIDTRIYIDPSESSVSNQYKEVKVIQIVYTLIIDSGPVSNKIPCWLLYNPTSFGTIIFYSGESNKNIGTLPLTCAFLSG